MYFTASVIATTNSIIKIISAIHHHPLSTREWLTACRLPQRLSKVYQIRLPTATLTKSHESTILKTIRGAAGRRFALNKFYGMTAYFVRVGRSFSFALKQSNDADDHQTKRKQRLICNHPASPPPFRDGGRNRLPFAAAPFLFYHGAVLFTIFSSPRYEAFKVHAVLSLVHLCGEGYTPWLFDCR